MKIGILTFHRAHNYGAVLQCYALQEFFKSEGHEVFVIDYRQPWIESFYSIMHLKYVRMNLKHPRAILRHVLSLFSRIKRIRKSEKIFGNFRDKYFHLTKACKSGNFDFSCDLIVIGSDQLWSTTCLGDKFDPVYLGSLKAENSPKIIGYAISANVRSINRLGSENLKVVAKRFDKLSFREECLISTIKKLSGKDYPLCVDPTLLTDETFWSSVINKKWEKQKYIVIYQARPYEAEPFLLRRKAEQYVKNSGKTLNIIDLSDMTYDVDDFISAIKYAEFVLTTSFHATVFSLLLKTPFYSFKLKDGHDGRYENLLNAVGAVDRCVDVDFEPKYAEIDFECIQKNINDYVKPSKIFLRTL